MLTLQDILDYCALSDDAPATGAGKEAVSLATAAQVGQQLLGTPEGLLQLYGMMFDNMRHAMATGQAEHLASLTRSFLDFHRAFPLPAATAPVGGQ